MVEIVFSKALVKAIQGRVPTGIVAAFQVVPIDVEGIFLANLHCKFL